MHLLSAKLVVFAVISFLFTYFVVNLQSVRRLLK